MDEALEERYKTGDLLQKLAARSPRGPWQALADEQRAGSALDQAIEDEYSTEITHLQAEVAAMRAQCEAAETAMRQLIAKVKSCLRDELLAAKQERETRETTILQRLESSGVR